MTAEDVRFSWTRLKNLKGNPSFYADVITTVQALNDTTVKVTLTDPSPAFLSIVAAPALSVLDSKLVKSKGGTDAADADKTDKAKDWLDQNSAGSGPFIQTSWKPKAEIVLEANPNYWRGKPKLGKVIIKHVADPTTALQMLQRGDADLADKPGPGPGRTGQGRRQAQRRHRPDARPELSGDDVERGAVQAALRQARAAGDCAQR